MTRCLIVLLMCTNVLSDTIGTGIDLKHELLTEILGRYGVASPQLHESQSILPFDIQFPVHDILKVDGASNEYLISATIQLSYQLDLLQWDANDTRNRYYDIDQVVLPRKILQSFWLPDIQLIDDDSIRFTIEHESARIVRDGRVIWMRRGLLTIFSPIDLTYYPFDRQYLRINLHNRQPTFKLRHQQTNSSKMNVSLSDSMSFWTRFLRHAEENLGKKTTLSNISFAVQENKPPVLLRGWFVRTLGIESRPGDDHTEDVIIYISIQRRRESHIYSTILPTLFFSVFIFVFYFSSIESYQRLTISLLHLFATLMFIIYLDKRISADQLAYTPLIIRYLSFVFLLEMLSLFFDHIIHSVYYGGVHFVSNWFRRHNDEASDHPARLSRVKLLRRACHSEPIENERESDILMKQLMEREESLKCEDYQRYQWHKRARLSECICCWFFFVIIFVVFLFLFFILPRLSLTKMI